MEDLAEVEGEEGPGLFFLCFSSVILSAGPGSRRVGSPNMTAGRRRVLWLGTGQGHVC